MDVHFICAWTFEGRLKGFGCDDATDDTEIVSTSFSGRVFEKLSQDTYPKRNEPSEAKTPTKNCFVVLEDARVSYTGQLTW
jgi:hypothetical protein